MVKFKPSPTTLGVRGMNVEMVVGLLRELGLTEYEGRAYSAMVLSGPSTAKELSRKASIPYSRIYEVLSGLEENGWIEVQTGRPAKYRARPPSEVLRLAKLERERKFKDVEEKIIRELQPPFEEKAEAKRPDVWIIRGEKSMFAKIAEMISKAEVEVLISIPKFAASIRNFWDYLGLLSSKNVEIKLLTQKKLKVPKLPNLSIKERKKLFGGGLIVDGKEVLLVLGGAAELVGIWSNDVGLSRFAKDYFDYLWQSG
ncbi:MAG: TrmB family transcriptional regulator [Candidatus Hadarchaeales archaeon]